MATHLTAGQSSARAPSHPHCCLSPDSTLQTTGAAAAVSSNDLALAAAAAAATAAEAEHPGQRLSCALAPPWIWPPLCLSAARNAVSFGLRTSEEACIDRQVHAQCDFAILPKQLLDAPGRTRHLRWRGDGWCASFDQQSGMWSTDLVPGSQFFEYCPAAAN